MPAEPLVSFCVVGTQGADLLPACLDAVAAEAAALGAPSEVLVLDNASTDGSAALARAHPAGVAVVALERRRGKAENDSDLLARARGRYALLLNEDSVLLPGAVRALVDALEADPGAATAGAALLRRDGAPQPSAWRFPGLGTTLAQALLLHRWLVVQSGETRRHRRAGGKAGRVGARRGDPGARGTGADAGGGDARGTGTGTAGEDAGDADGGAPHRVDWCQSACLLVRREASAAVGHLDPAYFVYGDEVDLQRRLADAGWHALHVPAARCVHHEQLSTGAAARPRIVELHRNHDRYLRTHAGRATALLSRPLAALPYALRAAVAVVLPGHDARRYAWHAAAALRPGRGEGLAERAASFNARLDEGG